MKLSKLLCTTGPLDDSYRPDPDGRIYHSAALFYVLMLWSFRVPICLYHVPCKRDSRKSSKFLLHVEIPLLSPNVNVVACSLWLSFRSQLNSLEKLQLFGRCSFYEPVCSFAVFQCVLNNHPSFATFLLHVFIPALHLSHVSTIVLGSPYCSFLYLIYKGASAVGIYEAILLLCYFRSLSKTATKFPIPCVPIPRRWMLAIRYAVFSISSHDTLGNRQLLKDQTSTIFTGYGT